MRRNILFLCHRLPYPPDKGDKIRSYALLRHLATRGKVSLGCFIDEAEDLKYVEKVRDLAGGDCYFEFLSRRERFWRAGSAMLTGKPMTVACFSSNRLKQWVDRALEKVPFDDVVVFGSAMAPYLVGAAFPKERVMFDMVDIDSDKWKQYAAGSYGPLSWIYRREARTLEDLERQAAEAFGQTLLASPYEVETFRKIAPASAGKIRSLTNGVDLGVFSSLACGNPFANEELAIVMTGRMDYRPNYEGAIWFATEIMPRILKLLPNTRVYFVGASPPRALRNVADSSIVVTGRVPDVRPYLQFARAVIAPLRIARGVQNKVLEAMAMGKLVIATHEATRSLAVEHGTQLWIENDPSRFAAAVIAVLQSPQRMRVAENARAYVERDHNWQRLLQTFDLQLDALRASSSFVESEHVQRGPTDAERASSRIGV